MFVYVCVCQALTLDHVGPVEQVLIIFSKLKLQLYTLYNLMSIALVMKYIIGNLSKKVNVRLYKWLTDAVFTVVHY